MKIGTLQAIGFSDSGIRRLFLVEGTLLAIDREFARAWRGDRVRGVVDVRAKNVVGGCGWDNGVDVARLVAMAGAGCVGWSRGGSGLHLLHVEKTRTILDAQSAGGISNAARTVFPQRRKGAKKCFLGAFAPLRENILAGLR